MTSVSWFPSSGNQTPDIFAAACSDGTVRLITRAGREEKKASYQKTSLELELYAFSVTLTTSARSTSFGLQTWQYLKDEIMLDNVTSNVIARHILGRADSRPHGSSRVCALES